MSRVADPDTPVLNMLGYVSKTFLESVLFFSILTEVIMK